jgi:putative protease
VVFDTGGDTNAEQGGRIYQVKGQRLFFEHGKIDFGKLRPGHRVWKTDDPALNKRLQQSYTGALAPRNRRAVDLTVSGREGTPLTVETCGVAVQSGIVLQAARTAPLTDEKLRDHLGRFGDHPYQLGTLRNQLDGALILPIGELNRIRRELAFALDAAFEEKRRESPTTWREFFGSASGEMPAAVSTEITALVRSDDQLGAALDAGISIIYADYEDIRRYKDVVAKVRAHGGNSAIFLATPRIQKAGEQGFFKLIESALPDGVLIRNLGAIDYFRETSLRRIGDFSLNVANPLTAAHFIDKGLERITISYDLNIQQVLDLALGAPPEWFELTLHQHMPMFHMEHCVFAAFMSTGSSFLDCGRPCEKHRVHLRDRVGMEHPLRADVGCRNTLFNAVAQTGARYFPDLQSVGIRRFRVELLEESREESLRVLNAYKALASGERGGEDLWQDLHARSQLGVTQGTLVSG